MKLKSWHLFAFITILFVCSFLIVNQKFDKFYRVNGINNDNRVLIETYLDKKEQEYLIDNQIDINLFIAYIKDPEFHLQNYQYYNALEQTSRYSQKDIVVLGNSLVNRLNYLYNSSQALYYGKLLIEYDLENCFLNEKDFNMNYIHIYKNIQPLYKKGDYSYVKDIISYIDILNQRGLSSKDDLNETFTQLCQSYNKESLALLFDKKIPLETQLVYNPKDFHTLVDKQHYIATYEPRNLILIQDLPRVKYAMYLQADAYKALLEMYRELSQTIDGCLVWSAYESYETFDKNRAGYDERQLGLTLSFSKSEVSYKEFESTDLSEWLSKHAHEYGFIIRYPKNKASITNHTFDPHTYRFVGKDLATKLYQEQLTLEEYVMNNHH